MAASMIVQTMFGGSFGCLNTAIDNSGWKILNDGAASTALPAYASGEALEVISSSAEDDSDKGAGVPGTGAFTVVVIYIDNDGTIDSQTVNLNGTAAVAMTDTTISRVLDMYTTTYGSGGVSAGNITIRTVSGSNGRMQILAGRRRAAPGRFTIPEDYVGVYKGFSLSNTTVSASAPSKIDYEIEAEINPLNGSYNAGVFTTIDWGAAGPASGIVGNAFSDAKGGRKIYLPEKTTIHARAKSDAAGLVTVAGFVYIDLVKNGEV